MTERSARLPRVTAQSLADQASHAIRSAIFEGLIQPEERLTIEHIAAELGMSRTPVREALKALENDGIVRILPNRGAVVQRFDRAEIVDRYTVRAALEGLAGELACRRGAPELAPVLRANCEQMAGRIECIAAEDLHAVRELVALNSDFHTAILQASGSEILQRSLAAMQMPMAYRLYSWRSRARRQALLAYHRQITAAVEQRRPRRVRQLLEAHVLEARDFLLAGDTQ